MSLFIIPLSTYRVSVRPACRSETLVSKLVEASPGVSEGRNPLKI